MKTRSRGTIWSYLLVVVGTTLLVSPEAWPQEQSAPASELTVGSRIRLLAPTATEGQLLGLLVEVGDTSLLVSAEEGTPVRVSREAITRLEVSTGPHRHALKGMIIGAGIGALLGAACYADQRNKENSLAPCPPSFVASAAVFGVAGAGWGAGIGALIKGDRWSEIPLERVRVSLAPTRGPGVGLSLSVAF